jgi:hypothetical protein
MGMVYRRKGIPENFQEENAQVDICSSERVLASHRTRGDGRGKVKEDA